MQHTLEARAWMVTRVHKLDVRSNAGEGAVVDQELSAEKSFNRSSSEMRHFLFGILLRNTRS
jgi:hypothetical protein